MSYLTYEQFGAIGDGVSSDFDAIIRCHNEANRTGTPVRAKDGATYYIDGRNDTAVIMTDVDFGTARFIIDDRSVENIKSYVFSVLTEHQPYDVKIDSLEKGATHVDFPHEGNVYVRVKNANEPIFIRKGLNMNEGTPTSDVFLVDKDGNVSPSVDHAYPEITSASARCIDDKPITVRGGTFLTIANQAPSFYTYYQRGFLVARANVTMCDFEHYVEGEGDHGAPYHGFIRSDGAVNLTIKNVKITPRFIYRTASKIPGKDVPMGSYDLSFWASINVTCENVKQTIDILDTRYWGVYTSNFCKNLVIDNCVFSRFDAHQGVTNATIRNCHLGHQTIQLIGAGEFLIENTTVHSHGGCFISLRGDYGATFDGNITVKNCTWMTGAKKGLSIICGFNEEDHDFGYPCVMGRNIDIDGLKVTDKDGNEDCEQELFLLCAYNKRDELSPAFPYITPKKVRVHGVSVGSGSYRITPRPDKYKDLDVETVI